MSDIKQILKKTKEKAEPLIEIAKPVVDVKRWGLTVVLVRGISLSSILIAMASVCVILTITMHFQSGLLYIIADSLRHTDRPLPLWLLYGRP